MSSKHHINTYIDLDEEEGFWQPGQEVRFQDGHICCKLASRGYDLMEAYEKLPHLRFIECKTDEDFVRFVGQWGPLQMWYDNDSGIYREPIERYRVVQRYLKALVQLMDASRNSDDDNGGKCRDWLPEFLLAELALRRQRARENRKLPLARTKLEPMLRHVCGIGDEEDVASWIRSADWKMVDIAVSYVLRNTTLSLGVYLECVLRNGKSEVEARPSLHTLEDALQCMVWCDVVIQHSLTFCRDCGKPFRAESARRRKYCNEVCAHRAAARNWIKEKRKRERNQGGDTNGTRKAR